MKKGYEVFRACSPSSSCDLAILKNGKLLKIEVRTGQKVRKAIMYNKENIHADITAVVLYNPDEIIYLPKL